jgi:hypothetical protein
MLRLQFMAEENCNFEHWTCESTNRPNAAVEILPFIRHARKSKMGYGYLAAELHALHLYMDTPVGFGLN